MISTMRLTSGCPVAHFGAPRHVLARTDMPTVSVATSPTTGGVYLAVDNAGAAYVGNRVRGGVYVRAWSPPV